MFSKGGQDHARLDVNQLLRGVLDDYRDACRTAHIVVQTRLEADLPPAFANRVQVEQVVCNLVANVIDAMRSVPGGQRMLQVLQSNRRMQTACLLVDVRMPGMTGLELYQHLHDAGTPVPAVIMTAHADDAARQSALRAGVRCYLRKPLQPDDLLACIRSVPTGQP